MRTEARATRRESARRRGREGGPSWEKGREGGREGGGLWTEYSDQ
jgi:hypothetical protein